MSVIHFGDIERTEKENNAGFGSYNESGVTYNESGETYGGIAGFDSPKPKIDYYAIKSKNEDIIDL